MSPLSGSILALVSSTTFEAFQQIVCIYNHWMRPISEVIKMAIRLILLLGHY